MNQQELLSPPQTYKPGHTFKAGHWEEAAAAGFLTETQIKKKGLRLKADAKPVAHINSQRGGAFDLYTEDQAQPKRAISEKQRNALKKARTRYNCEECYGEFPKKKLFKSSYRKGKFCVDCCEKLEEAHELKEWKKEQRQEAIAEAKALIARTDLVFLDTETTGLDAETCRIVDIAIVDFNLIQNIVLNTLINPGQPIPEDATEIHGITNSMVAHAPTFEQIQPEVQSLLTGKTVCIYNVEYDRPILEAHGVDMQNVEYVCIMTLYAKYYGRYSEYWESFTWQSLANALWQCKITPAISGKLHRALADCTATYHILQHMAKEAQHD